MAERIIRTTSAPGPGAGGRGANSRAYFEGLVSEMRRVTWPSQQEWVGATLLTVALVVTVSLYTTAFDHLFAWLFSLMSGSSAR